MENKIVAAITPRRLIKPDKPSSRLGRMGDSSGHENSSLMPQSLKVVAKRSGCINRSYANGASSALLFRWRLALSF